MPAIFHWKFNVRSYEIDQYGHVNNAVYLNYLEETAIRASTSVGFSNDWFEANGCLWLIRKMSIRYFEPAYYGDELEARSWVSDFRRVRSHREYEIINTSNDKRVIRARADWVFLERETMRPKRLLPEFEQAYDPWLDSQEDLHIPIRGAVRYPDSHRFVVERDVQASEIDRAQHVNNSVYLRWVEDAFTTAMFQVGWTMERMYAERFIMLAAAHEIEYFSSAKLGDRVRITYWAEEKSRVRGAWIYEIRHAKTNELFARNYAVGAFLHMQEDNTLKPGLLPDKLHESMRTGQPT